MSHAAITEMRVGAPSMARESTTYQPLARVRDLYVRRPRCSSIV
jgi:hypothetical protein